MPKPPPDLVLCANCLHKQNDPGKRGTCERCGCSPLPSYSYPRSSSFHPEQCKCVVKSPTKVNYKRNTPEPKLNLK